MQKVKIKYLQDINQPKWLNHYKIAESAYLISNNNQLFIEGYIIDEEIIQLLEIEPFSHGGLHTEKWVKVKFINQDEIIQELYLLESSWFGLGNGNRKLLTLLKEKSLL